MKRVDDGDFGSYVAVPVGRAEQKMSGKVDAINVQVGAARDFQVNHRQADRNPGSSIEDLVDEAVPRVVVPVAIADESLFIVEVLVEGADRIAARLSNAGPRFDPHAIEHRKVGLRIQRRIFDASDRQRRRREIIARRIHRLFQLGGHLGGPRA